MSAWTPHRRDLIAAAGVTALVGLNTSPPPASAKRGILLIDTGIRDQAALRAIAPGAHRIALEGDVVRAWRDYLLPMVTAAGGAHALARWDKTFVIRGLARESGLCTREEALARDLFHTRIGHTLQRNIA